MSEMNLMFVQDYFKREMSVLKNINLQELNSIADYIRYTCGHGGSRLFVFGNGGSGATASHFKCDLEKTVSTSTDLRFDVQCLNDNVFELMAISNDINYDTVFETQLAYKNLSPSDLVVVFSGSGNSKNIIRAVEFAKLKGCTTIGFVGFDGGKLKEICDFSLHVQTDDMQIVEDIHIMITHCIIQRFIKEFAVKDVNNYDDICENEIGEID